MATQFTTKSVEQTVNYSELDGSESEIIKQQISFLMKLTFSNNNKDSQILTLTAIQYNKCAILIILILIIIIIVVVETAFW